VLALGVCAPFLGRGYVLSYDMVFVPSPVVGGAGLGLDGGVPRAVPGDFLVALAATLLRSDLVQQVVLVGLLGAAAVGAWRLSPAVGAAGRAAAATLYAWNAYVFERLVLGHWALLVGYATLPWVALAGQAWRRRAATRPLDLARLVVPLGVAAATSPTGGLLAAGVAVAVLAVPEGSRASAARRTGAAIGLALVLNAPWWVPAVARPGGIPADPAGVAAFAARADSPLGTLGSLLTLGGVWNREVTPPGRDTWVLALGAVALIVIAALGAGRARRTLGRGAWAGLVALGLLGLALAFWGASPASGLLRELVTTVPGGGLLRDGQKWTAWWALLVAVGVGPGVERVVARLLTPWRGLVAGMLALLPIAVLPVLAWGAAGRLDGVRWPDEWARVSARVSADPAPGAVLVLPWQLYRAWPWNEYRTVLDPVDRMVHRRTVVRDDLLVGRVTVRGEDPRASAITAAVAAGGPLTDAVAAQGVRFVVVDRRTAGPAVDVTAELPGVERLFEGKDLALYRLPAAADTPREGRPPAAVVLLADVLAGGIFIGAASLGVREAWRPVQSARVQRRESE